MPTEPLRVVVCPDSFKGSLAAEEVAAAMVRGVLAARPDARVQALPMADGGEGTAWRISRAAGWEWRQARVTGPDGTALQAGWGLDPQGRRAVLDVASACGLDRISAGRRDPWRLDTRGVGELMRAALDAGARHLLVGLGGSGTVDGGAGLLAALGVRFRDAEGRELVSRPAELGSVAQADFAELDPRLGEVEITLLSDVDNPLTGPQGAAAVFGPQKGLAVDDVAAMDACLQRLAGAIEAAGWLRRPADAPGAGAAGGLGFALGCVLGGTARMGAAYVADLIGLDAAMREADRVITGEGRLDGQTAHGKVVAEVLRRAGGPGVPVAAVAGSVDADADELAALGLADVRALCDGSLTPEEAMARPAEAIAARTRSLIEEA